MAPTGGGGRGRVGSSPPLPAREKLSCDCATWSRRMLVLPLKSTPLLLLPLALPPAPTEEPLLLLLLPRSSLRALRLPLEDAGSAPPCAGVPLLMRGPPPPYAAGMGGGGGEKRAPAAAAEDARGVEEEEEEEGEEDAVVSVTAEA